jgi:hypothetical protein
MLTAAGSWLINTARGAIVVKEDVADALKSGHLRGYGGDVWFPQPAPSDHPLRTAANPWGGGNAMVPHMSGTSIDAQKVYLSPSLALRSLLMLLSDMLPAPRPSSTSTSPVAKTTGPRISLFTRATTPQRRTASAPRHARSRRRFSFHVHICSMLSALFGVGRNCFRAYLRTNESY